MSQKNITWLVSGLEIPAIGITIKGKSVMIDTIIADSLVEQGIATDGRLNKKENSKEGGKNK